MLKVSDILRKKGNEVYSVVPDCTVLEALQIMGEKNIGALMVIEDGELKGIFSERDYARKVVLLQRSSNTTLVSEIMTSHVITVSSDDSIELCMETMSARKFRHLPVTDFGVVKGIISIGDVVTAIINMQRETISHLQNYIAQ